MSYQQQNMDEFDYMAGGHEMADEIDDGGDGELGDDEFDMVCFFDFHLLYIYIYIYISCVTL